MSTLMFYYQTFVNAVRAVGGNNTNRWLVLQGGGDTTWLNSLPTDTVSNRLMVEYHNYTPFQFTQLQGDASWGAMQYYWGPLTIIPEIRLMTAARPKKARQTPDFNNWLTSMSARGFR